MNKLTLSALLLSLSVNLQAQTTFQKTYNLQSVLGVSGLVVTADSGYALAGFMDYQSWFLKLDPLGQVVISKKLETPDTYSVRSIDNCSDGGFILSADGRAGPQQFNLNLCKLDSMGNISWTKSFGNSNTDLSAAAKQVNDGGFIACGTTILQGNRTYVVKTDALGNPEWTKSYADTLFSISNNFPRDIIQTADLGYLICGNVSRGPSEYDSYLIKTNSTGDIIWNRIYENPEWNSFEKIKISPDGNYVLGGWVDGVTDSLDGRDMSLTKVDLSGNVIWSKAYQRSGIDLAFDLDLTSDGGYVLCGICDANSTISKCMLLKTDADGNLEWNKGFPMYLSFPNGNLVRKAADNGYVVGSTYAASFPEKIFLTKTDQFGEGGNCSQIPNTYTESSVSFTYTSSFMTGTNDSTESFNLITSVLNPLANTICFTNDINEINKRSPIDLYPNPVSQKLNFDILHGTEFQIINAMGSQQFLENKLAGNKIEVDVSKLSSGMYFLITENGYAKFVKE